MKPLISVVSASWNQGRYLAECHQSLLNVEEGLVEHIVIDNCSDDETHEVLAGFPAIDAVIEPDRGQSDALNKGFQRARGEWILWLNVDDFLCSGVMGQLLDFVQKKGEHYDMIYGHTVFVDADSKKIRTIYHPRWFYWMTEIGCYAAPSTGSLFRRDLLVENPLDEDFHMIMDTEWMLRVGKSLRVKRMNLETVSFRLDDNKTADHIQTGRLTPRHQKERENLALRFPAYQESNADGSSHVKKLMFRILRKFTRVWVLVDKFVSKYVLMRRCDASQISQ